jgi:hypothetical protein
MKTSTQRQDYADIARIIHGRPAASISRLPAIWQAIDAASDNSALSAQARRDYVEAAQLFRHHGTPLAVESLEAIGGDFDVAAYPRLDEELKRATTDLQRRTVEAVMELFAEFGYQVPASFYHVVLAAAFETEKPLLEMFKDKKELLRDRLWDAVLHAMLLVTPVGMRVQSVLSRHGVRFLHVMNCGCAVTDSIDAPFDISLDAGLKPAYLQNMMAASFEQYGVNASTSRQGRGF